jgi:multidrug resistance efflux pump
LAETNLEPIPTPLKLQMKRVRYQVFPVVIFLIALGLTIYLWRDYTGNPNGYGEVATVTVKVSAPRDGKLAAVDSPLRLYDHVNAHDMIARFDDAKLITQQEKVQENLSKAQTELEEANRGLEAAQKGGDKAKLEQLKAQVSTLRTQVAELRSELNQLEEKIASAKIEAPISGTVTAVHRQPNEFVKQGQEIMTITQESGSCILSYVRPGTGVVPKKDMRVLVRNQTTKKAAWTIVQEVGTHVEPIPEHQLTNAKRPEWGIPVRIAMPEASKLPLRPGELVVLNFSKE